MTMMMIAQGVAKAGKAGSRLLQPKFQNTRFGRLLRNRREQGNLTPGQEMNVLGRTATTATKQANLANRRYMGNLINRGLQGSVSAQRGLREAEADVRRTVADTGRRIFDSEERAKSTARENYARAMDKDKLERRQALIGTVGAIGETALKAGAQEYGARKSQTPDAITQRLIKEGRSATDILGILKLLQESGEDIDLENPEKDILDILSKVKSNRFDSNTGQRLVFDPSTGQRIRR